MKRLKFYIESLGCAKNLVDSEQVGSVFSSAGFIQTPNKKAADFLFVNTCCFIEDARHETFEAIAELSLKKGKNQKLIVLGCAANRYGNSLKEKFPAVDAVIKTKDYSDFKNIFSYADLSPANNYQNTYVSFTPKHTSYLKISEGCSHSCSFCAIPAIRGALKSEEIDNLIEKAKIKAGFGVKELNIIAQNSLSYGIDIYKKSSIIALLKELVKIKKLEWIRILYMYPTFINDELLDFIKSQNKICRYFDIPLQHIDKRILKLMNRPFDMCYYEKLIERIRNKMPDSFIRTTFITGFPSETKKEFYNLLKFIKKVKFDHLGAFAYSNEEGTKSYHFKKPIPNKEKQRRLEEIFFTQQEILEEKNKRQIGKIYDVIIDSANGRTARSGQYNYIGRTKFDAPEIDRLFYLKSEKKLKPGDIVKAKVTKADVYDLYGKKEGVLNQQ